MEQAISAQHELWGRMSRTNENLRKSGASKITVALVQSTLTLLDQKWVKLEDQHEKLRAEHWETFKSHDYLKLNFMNQAEEMYVQQRAALVEILEALPKLKGANESRTASEASSIAKLPQIDLPKFSGNYEDWPEFRDLFSSLILKKDGILTDVDKLHYLKVSVKGDADKLLRGLTVTDGNFTRAWSMLTEHYENKRHLVGAYISSFTALPKMKSESASDLRRIFHSMVGIVGSLDGIGRPISNCTDSSCIWWWNCWTPDQEESGKSQLEPPSYEELRLFLEEKLHTLDSLSSRKVEPSPSKSENPIRTTRAHHAKGQDETRKRCPLCTKQHYVLFCSQYKSKSAQERKTVVDKHKLCLNCLG